MDPFARKMWRASLLYGLLMLVLFAALSVVYFHLNPRCSDRKVAEVQSPDKQWTATVMERRCGEEAPFLTHVNLRRSSEPAHSGFISGMITRGEVFLVEQDAAAARVSLRWLSPRDLTIDCPGCSPELLRKSDEHWQSTTIHYQVRGR